MESILESLKTIELEIHKIRTALTDNSEALEPKSAKYERQPNRNSKLYSNSLPASDLGPMPSITDTWPMAVDQKMIVSAESESDKQFRALQVSNLIRIPMTNKVVLDFGCGEGHNPSEMANIALKVIGFDIKKHEKWSKIEKNNLIFTDDVRNVDDHGPYDLIVLYDVIDHIVGEDPQELLKRLRNLLAKDGRMFMRAHPWTSRTGGHYYESMNKAFIHLVITPDEAIKSGIKINEPNLKVARPMAAYEQWFKEAGLEVVEKRVKTTEVESFFDGPVMDRIIKINWGGGIDSNTARKIMSNHFIDYVLKAG